MHIHVYIYIYMHIYTYTLHHSIIEYVVGTCVYTYYCLC